MSRLESAADLEQLREQVAARREAKQTWVAVCGDRLPRLRRKQLPKPWK
jgi:hypothetical protein